MAFWGLSGRFHIVLCVGKLLLNNNQISVAVTAQFLNKKVSYLAKTKIEINNEASILIKAKQSNISVSTPIVVDCLNSLELGNPLFKELLNAYLDKISNQEFIGIAISKCPALEEPLRLKNDTTILSGDSLVLAMPIKIKGIANVRKRPKLQGSIISPN